MLRLERQYWEAGHRRLAGVDEAGRGPLAGPVVAAAVVLEPALAEREYRGVLGGLTDSKKLSPVRREAFHAFLTDTPGIEVGVGVSDHGEIDRVNILQATYLAMARALSALPALPDLALVDGLPASGLPCASEAFVGGDGRSLSIAAASIIAKVTRDRMMAHFDAEFPGYGFGEHKGYGTARHLVALRQLGPCCIHRHTFRPVREAQVGADEG